MSSSLPAGARRPFGTLFPWQGPGSSGGDDFRAGDSPLAAPGDGCWLVVHSSHAPLRPGDMRTRACDPLSPSYSPGELQAQHVSSVYWAPPRDPDLSSPHSSCSRDGKPKTKKLSLLFPLGLSSSSAFFHCPSSPDLLLSRWPCSPADISSDRASVPETGHRWFMKVVTCERQF